MPLFLSSVWNFLKKYWWIFLLGGVFLYFRHQNSSLEDIIKVKTETYDKQIQVIQEIHKQEIEQRENLIKEYQAKLEEIEKNYQEQTILLEQEKRKKIKVIVMNFQTNPEKVIKQVEKTYGLRFIK